MNQELHWNNIASKYNDEVLDAFKSDKERKLEKYFKKHAGKNVEVVDFGCGIGKAFPYLASSCKKILALDISARCLSIAKSNSYSNITYKRQDLTQGNLRLPMADFALCCNVAILPELDKNRAIIKNVQKTLRKNGTAIFVVPSLESTLFSSWRLVEWYKKEGVAPKDIPGSELNCFKGGATDIIQGVIHIDGVPTKHYSQAELQVLFDEANLTITAIDRLEYDWSTEFSSVPKWLKAPYPWDWLIECKK